MPRSTTRRKFRCASSPYMLGLPEEEGDRFRTWIHEILELGITEPAVLMKAIGEMTKYFQAEIEKRRSAPRDDLIS